MYRKNLYIKYFAYTGDIMAESATMKLLGAVRDDDIKACREALENGANVRARYNNGRTLVEMALLNNDFEMIKTLVENNANVNTISEHGKPMLATAIEYGDINMVKYLIEQGANVNAQTRHATLLTYAIKTRRRDIAMLLLEKGANPNGYDSFENSAIMATVRQNDVEMLKALIMNGARMNFNDNADSFFYKMIIDEASEEVKKVLEDNFGNAYKNNDRHKAGKFSPVKVTDVNFSSVIGLENVKEELKRDIVYQIRHAELAKDFKVSMNGGMLLYGPPGNGKTMIVKAVAGETGANLIEVRIHDVLDMWVGNISKAVKRIFDRARKNTPCIVFIDEAEMLGSNRDSTERQPWLREALGTLLTELDGISSQNEGVLVIGATNAPWMVDAALKRHGRLGKFLFVPMPKKEERIELFKLYLKGRPVGDGIDFEKISEIAGNCTASDIKTICDEAAKLAWVDSIDKGKQRGITMKDITASIGKERFNAREWYDMAKQHITRDDKDLYKDFIESAASYEKDWRGDVAMYR